MESINVTLLSLTCMGRKNYDIFISYRRKGGFETAKHLYDLFIRDGYRVSFDIDTLREGFFDSELLKRIDECKDYILIIDSHCFDRTLDPNFNPQNDWLRQELAYAIKKKKNIIPIFLNDEKYYPNNLPEDIEPVTRINGPQYNTYYFDDFYKTVKNKFLTSKPKEKKYLKIGVGIGLLILLIIGLSLSLISLIHKKPTSSNTLNIEEKINGDLINIEEVENKSESGDIKLKITKEDVHDNNRLQDQNGMTYGGINMFDDNPNTGWAVDLTKAIIDNDLLLGPYINLNAKRITGIWIQNGYAKNKNVYNENMRAAWILIYRSDNWSQDYPEDSDILYKGPLKDRMNFQKLEIDPKFDNSKPTKTIAIAFPSYNPNNPNGADYYIGKKFKDLVISEIAFYGEPM